MKISVVTSIYNSANYLEEYYSRHLKCIQDLGLDHEFVFVNDGSPDNSIEVATELSKKDPKVVVVDLSRNFGQYAAIFAGLKQASGDLIFMSDADLEDAPENLTVFYNELLADDKMDVVYGVMKARKGGFVRKKLGGMFFKIMAKISGVPVPGNQAWQRIMTKRYVDALMTFDEVETFPAGLLYLTGFGQKPHEIEREYKGSSTYSFIKRMNAAIDAISSFSSKPLFYIGMLGFGITIFSFLLLIYIFVSKLFVIEYQAGWSTVITSVWFIGGLMLTSIGIVGIYLSKIFNQVKKRPVYIVKDIVRDGKASS